MSQPQQQQGRKRGPHRRRRGNRRRPVPVKNVYPTFDAAPGGTPEGPDPIVSAYLTEQGIDPSAWAYLSPDYQNQITSGLNLNASLGSTPTGYTAPTYSTPPSEPKPIWQPVDPAPGGTPEPVWEPVDPAPGGEPTYYSGSVQKPAGTVVQGPAPGTYTAPPPTNPVDTAPGGTPETPTFGVPSGPIPTGVQSTATVSQQIPTTPTFPKTTPAGPAPGTGTPGASYGGYTDYHQPDGSIWTLGPNGEWAPAQTAIAQPATAMVNQQEAEPLIPGTGTYAGLLAAGFNPIWLQTIGATPGMAPGPDWTSAQVQQNLASQAAFMANTGGGATALPAGFYNGTITGPQLSTLPPPAAPVTPPAPTPVPAGQPAPGSGSFVSSNNGWSYFDQPDGTTWALGPKGEWWASTLPGHTNPVYAGPNGQLATAPGQPGTVGTPGANNYNWQGMVGPNNPFLAGPTPQQQYQGFLNRTQGALPAPNQIVAREWQRLPRSTQELLLAAYEQEGWSADDIQWIISQLLPGRAGVRRGTYGTIRR